MLEVEDITKHYGPNRGIENLSLTVQQGEILGLLGPNGAGKTTTLRIITGYLPATSGHVRVDGYELWTSPYEVRRRIGYLPDNPPMYPDMTVLDYLTFMAEMHEVPRAERDARVDAVIERLQLGDVAGRLVGRLSRGYRQRVGLAQAVVHDPSVLVCDEPTVGLDPRQIAEMRELIRDFGQRHAVIFSSHVLSEVQMLCDKIVIVHEGKVHARGTPAELTAALQGAPRWVVRAKGPADQIAVALRSVNGVTSVTNQFARGPIAELLIEAKPNATEIEDAVFAVVSKGGWALRELRPLETSLEQVFLELTKTEQHERGKHAHLTEKKGK